MYTGDHTMPDKMISRITCLTACALLSMALLPTGLHAQEGADEMQWELTFSDEFDGEAVDTDKWEVLTRKNSHNNEIQYYLPKHASIVDGKLRITAIDEPHDGKDYQSARLESWFSQTYGRFEVRAKIPTTKGIWPAIWLLPRDVRWPHGGEIDIMEHGGSKPAQVLSAYHFANAEGEHEYVDQTYTKENADGEAVRFPDNFHIYAAEWTPQEIVFFVDGVEHYRLNKQQVPVSDTPMSIVLNTAVGGWFDGEPDETTVFPQHFDIDYVRVYKSIQASDGAEKPSEDQSAVE